MLEIEYALTADDFAALDRHLTAGPTDPRRSFRRWNLVALVAMIGFGAALIAGGVTARLAILTLMLLIGVFLGVVLCLMFTLRAIGHSLRAQPTWADAAENQWLFEPVRVSLGRDGMTITAPRSRTEHDWSLVWKIEQTPEHLFLFLTTTAAQIVPRRAFHDADHFEQFVAFARMCRDGRGAEFVSKLLSRRPRDRDKGIWDADSSY